MTPLLLAASFGISVIFKLPPECADTLEFIYNGCVLTDNLETVYIRPTLTGRYRNYVITHEIGHIRCIERHNDTSEKCAKDYAGVMMKRYNW